MTSWLENPLTEKYVQLKSKLESPNLGGIKWCWTTPTGSHEYGFKTYLTNPNLFCTFGHVLWEASGHKNIEGSPVSDVPGLSGLVYDVVREVLQHNGLSMNNLYRACLNLALPQGDRSTIPHVDHFFDHNVLIVYLESDNDSGNTVVCKDRVSYKEEQQPLISIDQVTPMVEFVPVEDSVVIFDGSHYHYTKRASKARIALVATYD